MKTIRNMTGVVILTFLFALQGFADEYSVDKSKSAVKWSSKKVVGGHFGTIELKSGRLNVESRKILSGEFLMDMTTIVNEDISNEAVNRKLVGHLKSDDFFSVDKHPVSTLIVRKTSQKSENVFTFSGDLTIKGITHPVVFDATVSFLTGKISANGKMEIDRTLYDIRYGSGKFFSGLGDNMIHDNFSLDFSIEFEPVGSTVLQ